MAAKLIFISAVTVCLWNLGFTQDVIYHIDEELANSSYIGNICDDSNLLSAISGSDSSTLKYSFLTTGNQYAHYFRVDENSGDLYTNGIIDREQVCEYIETCMLIIQIAVKSELGSFFRVLKVHVFINDINDHSPVFSKPNLTLTISEAVLAGTSYAIDGARDRDTSSQYSLKEYRLESKDPDQTENLPFSIQFQKHLDGSSIVRLFVIKPLDREIIDSYFLEVIAEDGDVPPRQGRLPIYIVVLDENDNQPTFNAASYNTTVSEETEKGSVILKLNATDLDADDNGKISYMMSPHQTGEIFRLFDIVEDTGEIILKERITFAPNLQYRIIVEAFDNPPDGQPLSTQTLVLVSVENTGNNAPEIVINLLTQTNNAEVSELATIGTVVAYVVVVDHDEGRQGIASCIIQSSGFDIQMIDMNKYKIFVSQSLDYERTKIQKVTVHCQDNGNPPLPASASFNITITDRNDHAPVFALPSFSKNVREDASIGSLLTTVTASDLDSGKNGQFHFEVSRNYEFKDYFYFENMTLGSTTGNLRLNKSLDRDKKASYVIPIYAIDVGEEGEKSLTGAATIKLHITDVNDEKPVFTEVFTFVVLENLPADAVVGRLTAIDKDLGMNAQVVYSLHPSYKGKVPFVVFEDGTVKTNQELDRETIDRYEFKVVATDEGEPPLSSSGTVIVKVSDANDKYPNITFPRPSNNTISIEHSVSPWHVVCKIIARDDDEQGTTNSRLRYDVIGRNDSDLFQVNPATGVIQITETMPRSYIGKVFKLDILVADFGKPRANSVQSDLFIKIKSSNGTAMAAESNDVLSNQNILIAIIVGVVTVVLSVGIVATIFIIRRIDRERKEEQRRKNNNQIKVDPDLDGKRVFDGSITVFSLPSEDSLLGERKKKEVSFSLEDDVFSDDDLIQKNGLESSHRHFKPNLTYLSAPSPRKVEDNHSETSGDTGTSDSGRGGSDEEIHSTTTSQSPRDKMMDFNRPLPPLTHQEIIPFSFKKGMSLSYNRDFNSKPDVINSECIEMTRHDLDPRRQGQSPRHDLELQRQGLSTMAVHLPNDSLDRSCNKVVLLQTDSGIHSDTNSNEGEVRDYMV
ncbi:hypothetical protein ACF0H5_010263 [Mactra antiquata]